MGKGDARSAKIRAVILSGAEALRPHSPASNSPNRGAATAALAAR